MVLCISFCSFDISSPFSFLILFVWALCLCLSLFLSLSMYLAKALSALLSFQRTVFYYCFPSLYFISFALIFIIFLLLITLGFGELKYQISLLFGGYDETNSWRVLFAQDHIA